ncbi:sigma 54-interacting transcriptional regulator [Syntrophomonas palmitatica]|uniref:sigma 54-interacting transcriptional regulator n=1 Tax=Syntrophomonas palmitatica TaxID=402877 RepID=UPI0006D25CE2|nr:sigma 54-interacting transcriptional regulator [Syntrophomonas palmitatica]
MSLNIELHSKELLLYPILQNIDQGILITDTSFNVIFFNEKAEQIFQLKAEDILGKSADTLKPSLLFNRMIENHQRLVYDQVFVDGEQYVLTKGLLELSPDTFAAYAIAKPVDNIEDSHFNSLMQSPYEGILVFDENLRLIYANQTCYQFFKSKSQNELYDEIAPILLNTRIEDALLKAKPMTGDSVSVKGHYFDLVYLPIIRHGHPVGIIAKSLPLFRNERTWGQLVEEYNQGTANYYFQNIVGDNASLVEQKELATRAAKTISTVLITGESGTGKEIFAHAIHNMSPRRKGPFIKVNCAAVPETLLESELFGYAEGAFTGARKEGKPGKFELANHGTIFLDEIGDMSFAMQAKLLRVLQEKELERVGAVHTTKVDVRVIAATNQNLDQLVAANKFRQDLYYRLNVIVLYLPPLRERKDDIAQVSRALLQRLNQQLGTRVNKISNEVLEYFKAYAWPGNIRELENTLERAINFCDSDTINIEHIPPHIINNGKAVGGAPAGATLETILEQHEREVILNTLQRCGGNRSQAARSLNIHRSVLYRKMNKYQIGSN